MPLADTLCPQSICEITPVNRIIGATNSDVPCPLMSEYAAVPDTICQLLVKEVAVDRSSARTVKVPSEPEKTIWT